MVRPAISTCLFGLILAHRFVHGSPISAGLDGIMSNSFPSLLNLKDSKIGSEADDVLQSQSLDLVERRLHISGSSFAVVFDHGSRCHTDGGSKSEDRSQQAVNDGDDDVSGPDTTTCQPSQTKRNIVIVDGKPESYRGISEGFDV